MHAPRLTKESGFGLVELLIAMTILQVALLAIVGAMGSGAVAMGRSAHVGVAGSLADEAIEQYRAYVYGSIGLNTGGSTSATYLADAACTGHGGSPPCQNLSVSGCTANPQSPAALTTTGPNPCSMVQTLSGPDGRPYVMDTYIQSYTAPAPAGGGTPRSGKLVTVVVIDGGPGGHARELARESSIFDCATGGSEAYNTGC